MISLLILSLLLFFLCIQKFLLLILLLLAFVLFIYVRLDLVAKNIISEMACVWEKQGGNLASLSRIESFNSLISDCALMDLESKGLPYTW